jgi:hypothetical protein
MKRLSLLHLALIWTALGLISVTPTRANETISSEFKTKLQGTLIKHLNQLMKDDGSVAAMQGKRVLMPQNHRS